MDQQSESKETDNMDLSQPRVIWELSKTQDDFIYNLSKFGAFNKYQEYENCQFIGGIDGKKLIFVDGMGIGAIDPDDPKEGIAAIRKVIADGIRKQIQQYPDKVESLDLGGKKSMGV